MSAVWPVDLRGLRGTEMSRFDDKTIPAPELTAEQRQGVLMVRGLFLAYIASGFTEDQAMDLVKTHLASAAGSS